MSAALGLLLSLCGVAAAESAWVHPRGAYTLYGGLGYGTFQYGSSGLIRDRQMRGRVDLYGAVGLGHRLQLSVDAPLIHAWVLEHEDRGPCPREGDYCDPVTTVGESGLHLRWQALQGPLSLSLDAGLRSDAWNAGTRQRWTNAGLGTTQVLSSVVLERSWPEAGWGAQAWGRYGLVFGRPVGDLRLPADTLAGGLAVQRAWRSTRVELSVGAWTRLGGAEFEDWVGRYSALDDRWAALAYRQLSARLKWSFPLGETGGLHVSAGRVLLAANGPEDATDLSVGVHRYFAPRSQRDGG
ncbi:MAG: hypothetical protein H6740_28025 [Alphaproteobacteria bacterium]|nr:hypothetical protein [Alphaproteobacteria bacterium]